MITGKQSHNWVFYNDAMLLIKKNWGNDLSQIIWVPLIRGEIWNSVSKGAHFHWFPILYVYNVFALAENSFFLKWQLLNKV